MRSALKFLLMCLLSSLLANCSMFSKDTSDDEKPENPASYDGYSSSEVYEDIKGASRDGASEDYADDDYGDIEGSSEDEALLMDSGEEPQENDPLAGTVAEDPLPVEKLEEPKKKAVSKAKKSSSKFKNGMYRFSVNCNMRSKPSTQSKAVGKVEKGKKLWVEGHNADWVKVFKKSGAVYVNKGCL